MLKQTLIFILLLVSIIIILFSPTHLHNLHRHGNFTISRDTFGVATLHVSTLTQYFYGLGVIYAEDRLFQLAFRAYAAQGRLSQFLGEKSLEFDRYMREINFKYWAKQKSIRFKAQNETQFQLFSQVVKGINDRVANMSVLPFQFYLTGVKWQNFTMDHLFYLSMQFQWAASHNIFDQYTRTALLNHYSQEELQWLLPNKKQTWAFNSVPIIRDQEIPDRLRTKNMKQTLQKIKFNPSSVERPIDLGIIQYQITADASNCWAVSGNYTESGLPLLSNDPHLESIIPNQWYFYKINFTSAKGNINAAGATFPGSFNFFGRTPYFSTGCTISHGDNQDLFKEQISGDKYFVNGQWKNLKIRNETIYIKSRFSSKVENYLVKQTHRGPIIHYIFGPLGSYNLQNQTISLSWTGFNNQWDSFTQLAYSMFIDNFEQLKYALQNLTKAYYNANIIATTKDNHILTQQTGVHPLRRNGQSGNYVKDGTTTEHDWVGLVPPEDRIQVSDPPKGYLINANNRVAETGYYGGYLDYTIFTARADRVDEILRQQIKSGRKINVDFAKKVLLDTVDVYCRQILPQIRSILEQSKQLSNFDCDFKKQSHLATMYEVFFYELYRIIKPKGLPNISLLSGHHMQQGIFNYIHFAYRGDDNKKETMKRAWSNAIVHLQKHFKTKDQTEWKWSRFHQDWIRHVPFRNIPFLSKLFELKFPSDGNFHTPNVAKMDQLQIGNFDTIHKANLRMITGFGQNENWFLLDTGISENIFSSHYSDMWSIFKKGEMLKIFEQGQIDNSQL